MRNDISIQGISPVTSTGDPGPELKEAAPIAAPHPPSATSTPIFVNPALRLEPALGLVVIEFRNSTGAVTNSIPTARQLQEYKQHARIEVGSAHAVSAPKAASPGQTGLGSAGPSNDPASSSGNAPSTPGAAAAATPNSRTGGTSPSDALVEALT